MPRCWTGRRRPRRFFTTKPEGKSRRGAARKSLRRVRGSGARCPVWFLAQCTYNASLDWTSVSSSTILSTVSGYELMSTCRSHADCWLTQQYPRQAVHVCTLHRVSEREVPLLEARWGGCNVRGPPIGCSMRIPVSHPVLYSYCCVRQHCGRCVCWLI